MLKEFIGTLTSRNTPNGIFITTSRLTKEAKNYIASNEIKNKFNIIIFEGENLVETMIESEIGVQIKEEHKFKVIDEDYFKAKKKK